jgi:hypothetical protein
MTARRLFCLNDHEGSDIALAMAWKKPFDASIPPHLAQVLSNPTEAYDRTGVSREDGYGLLLLLLPRQLTTRGSRKGSIAPRDRAFAFR